MKLSRLYSSHPDVFAPIDFNEGLSVILAEIRLPANRGLDTHNLGKTTVGELIDFCLLKGKSANFFLFKHETRFFDYTFYLELQLLDGSYLTIARPVVPGSRIDILRTTGHVADLQAISIDQWDHTNLPFDKAKRIIDGIFNFDSLSPWPFRKLIGYLIRSQADYLHVFQLGKFSGKHQDWKPFVAHLLGMSAGPVIDLYDKREEQVEANGRLKTLVQEWGSDDVDPSVVDGLISVKRREVELRAAALESFNFAQDDTRVSTEVVQSLEVKIAALNEDHYRTSQLVQRLSESLKDDQTIFRTKDAEALFSEAGVAFGQQLKKNYDQLVEFNRAITRERREELLKQLRESNDRLKAIDLTLPLLNVERAHSLEFLRESESLAKYKELSLESSGLQAELASLEARRAAAARLIELRREVRQLSEEYGHLQTAVEQEIESISGDETSRFGRLRSYFNEIVASVLGQNAILAVSVNAQGGLEFIAEFVGETGVATSGDRGTSYKKLLCIAFDLAMLRAHLDVPFARFVFHDGALEQLEPRKRQNLIVVLREYANLGIQPIITALNSDLPESLDSGGAAIKSAEVVRLLHDEGQDGRLFNALPW